jgi:hypothetical protein
VRKNLLYKLISIFGVFVYAVINYFQSSLQRKVASFSPSKEVSSEIEHLGHYAFYHTCYFILVVIIIWFWFQSLRRVKQAMYIHLALLTILFFSALAFKKSFFLLFSGYLTTILLNDVLQKPIFPLLLLAFFIIENKEK